MTEQAVRVERSGPVSTVFLHRPARRNAVDGPTAAELAAVFRAFDADPDSAVAVLHGEGGVFCSGADLTAIGTERGNRVAPDGDGPMGITGCGYPSRSWAVSGYAVGRHPRLGPVVRPAGSGRDRHLRRLCRRWGVPLIDGGPCACPAHRDQPGDGHHPHQTHRRHPGGGGDRSGQPRRPPAGQALATAQELAAVLAAFPQFCLRSDGCRRYWSGGSGRDPRPGLELAHGRAALAAETAAGAARFPPAPAATDPSAPGGWWPPAGLGQPPCATAGSPPATSTILVRLDVPAAVSPALRRTPNASATEVGAASVALPSTARALALPAVGCCLTGVEARSRRAARYPPASTPWRQCPRSARAWCGGWARRQHDDVWVSSSSRDFGRADRGLPPARRRSARIPGSGPV